MLKEKDSKNRTGDSALDTKCPTLVREQDRSLGNADGVDEEQSDGRQDHVSKEWCEREFHEKEIDCVMRMKLRSALMLSMARERTMMASTSLWCLAQVSCSSNTAWAERSCVIRGMIVGLAAATNTCTPLKRGVTWARCALCRRTCVLQRVGWVDESMQLLLRHGLTPCE